MKSVTWQLFKTNAVELRENALMDYKESNKSK